MTNDDSRGQKYQMKTKNSEQLFEIKHHIAGGVNSPVRAFKSVGGSTIFLKSRGCYHTMKMAINI